jgi:hypothetical protein
MITNIPKKTQCVRIDTTANVKLKDNFFNLRKEYESTEKFKAMANDQNPIFCEIIKGKETAMQPAAIRETSSLILKDLHKKKAANTDKP